MKKIHFILVALIFCQYTTAHAQENFWNSPNAYLGQTPPGNTPVKFAPGLISDTAFFSFDRSTFTPD